MNCLLIIVQCCIGELGFLSFCFEEFLQSDVNPSILNPALKRILPDGERCSEVAEGIEECIKRLQAETNASDEAAKVVLSEI